ncbi:DUF4169 family protein [Limimaricola litoreus]|uniref:DUF4169 family protein n=1 Tax=Limimaricola litoreus TaxID=2955316 RepID=A0A9X2FXI7_9RHOB|nr:DUF4169 family protein [Limimaricola litoreus]MCP1170256.1 DUF4169 family protein [Limimaricola litoreus]
MKPVNLNQFRKQKARAEKTARADANAAKFGRTKAEKARDAAEAESAARRLDGHRRDDE